jgi:putative membrane protein
MHRLLICTGLAVVALGTGAGRAHAATVSGLDEQFLKTSVQGDRFEIAGGKLALAKTQNAAVRTLAARVVKDHTKSLKESLALAKRLGISAPKRPTPSMQWELQIVSTLSGAAFDHWYSDLEVKDHMQDISEAADEAHSGANAAIRRSARQEIPTLRKHLKLAREALKASPAA